MITLRQKPLLLHYFLTRACNCACSFCNIYKQKGDTADINSIKTNLKLAREFGTKFVDFTGGEPLLYKELPEALGYAKSLGFITSVTTNGILLKKRVPELKGLIDLPHVSLDGSSEIHNRLRGRDCYKDVIEGLEECVKNKIKCDIIFTLTDENKNEIDHVYKIARKYKAVLILDPVFSYFENSSFNEFDHLFKLWGKKRGVYVNRAFTLLRKNGGNSTNHPVCRAVDSTIVISPENRLLLPCFHSANSEQDINGNLKELMAGDKRKTAIKNQGRYNMCEGCTINCYMDPSFMYTLNRYFFLSMFSKLKYIIDKLI